MYIYVLLKNFFGFQTTSRVPGYFCIVVCTLGTCGRGNETAIQKCIIQQEPGPGDGDLLPLLANSFCRDSELDL